MKHIWVFAALLSLVVTGCTAEWIIPEDYYVEFENKDDCPDTAQCRQAEDGTSVCITDGRAECGNGVQETGETCDDGDGNASSAYTLSRTCNRTCTGYTGYCGDNIENGDEACDDGNATADGNGCSATCQRQGACGDGLCRCSEWCQ